MQLQFTLIFILVLKSDNIKWRCTILDEIVRSQSKKMIKLSIIFTVTCNISTLHTGKLYNLGCVQNQFYRL